ncbi:uncharacterized protein [Montipora capricornis]|uniref:uncharacterized protein n=1 Tax=Montipora capricornis TaxID=246305 RepID=UPI0035F1AB8C
MAKFGLSGLICIICWFYQAVVVSAVAVPDEGDVRLADGGAPTQGRVEIYINGSWWTVCSDGFSYDEARVVCRMLWLPQNPNVYRNNPFGGSNGSILTERYDCDGHETSLLNCARRRVSYYCSRYYWTSFGISCGPLIMSECGGVVTEPLGQLYFKRGQKVTETQCQWTMGDISKENGKHIVLVPERTYTWCSFSVSVWDGNGNWLSHHSCGSEWFFIYTSYPGVTVKLRSYSAYDDVFSVHYAVINGSLESAPQVHGWNVTIVSVLESSITLQWPKLSSVFGNRVSAYIAVIEDNGCGKVLAGKIISPNFTLVAIDGLRTGKEYQAYVVVRDVLGQPYRSAKLITSTMESVPSASPYFYVQMQRSDSIRILISPISEQYHNGKLLGYTIIYQDACFRNSTTQVNVSVLTTTYTITGLKAGTWYDVSVAAFTSKGTGPYRHRRTYTAGCEGHKMLIEGNGTLHSHNNPCYYRSVLSDCNWTIEPQLSSKPTKTIWIKFNAFSLNSDSRCRSGDLLIVTVGDKDSVICGYVGPFSLVVHAEQVHITYRVTRWYTYSRFSASYVGLQGPLAGARLSSWNLSVRNVSSSSVIVEWGEFPLNVSVDHFAVMFTEHNKSVSVLFRVNTLYQQFYNVQRLLNPNRLYRFQVLAFTSIEENETYSSEIKAIMTSEGGKTTNLCTIAMPLNTCSLSTKHF